MTKAKSVFDNFTGKYQLSKTLRFELRPVPETKKMLAENKVFEKDQTIDDSYNQAKFYFDKLHQKFIDSALSLDRLNDLSFQIFADVLSEQNKIISSKKKEISELRKEKKDQNNAKIASLQNEINRAEDKTENKKKELYKDIRKLFDNEADTWKKDYQKKKLAGQEIKFSKADLKQKGVNFLTAAGILKVLKYEFPQEKEAEFQVQAEEYPSLFVEEKENPGENQYIFDSFDGFTTYLSKFQQTRKNLYADDGTATAVATRIVDNFVIFWQNWQVFNEKYQSNHSAIGFNEISIFEIAQYKNYFLQKNIEDLKNENSYNKIIGRINQKIKEHRDQKTKDKAFKKSNFPFFKILDKQILGHVEKEKQLIEKTKEKSEEQVLVECFKEFIKNNQERFGRANTLMNIFFAGEFEDDYEGIYLKNKAINTISRRWFANNRDFELKLPQQKSKNKSEKDEPKIKKFISISEIKSAVEELEGDVFKTFFYDKTVIASDKDDQKQNKWLQFLAIWKYEFDNLFRDIEKENGEKLFGYNTYLKEAEELEIFPQKKEFKEKATAAIKNYTDAGLGIFQIMKYFSLDDKDRRNTPSQLSTNFYAQYDEYYKDFAFIKYYNAFRNYITKKPFNENKIKLNFNNAQLLGGFDKNKEKEKLGIILRKDKIYYLGIINTNYNTIFDEKQHSEAYRVNSDDVYKKMEYKFFPDPKRMIPKIAFAYKNRKKFGWTQEIQNIKDEYAKLQEEKKNNRDVWGKQFDKNKTMKLIYYYQQCLELGGYKETFNFSWKSPNMYSGIGEFNDDIARQNYFISFVNVDKDYVRERVKNGELYLFQIYSKDFSNASSGVKNIHSLYFLNLFRDNNIKDLILRLSGNAEVFYRKKSLIPEKEKRKFPREITKYKRYTESKVFFHIPISLNANNGIAGKYNQDINKKIFVNKKDEINIIGIDRGEKNLLYYSVINPKGEILEQGSLNEINGVNYHQKLIEREKDRLEKRQSWQPVAKIKDLKKGYLSHIIHIICQLIEKYNAIIVLEDLNMRFKQIRGGIERSVYQQFEKALIDKLGYLVFKDNRNLRAPGGVLNGYQLAAPFVSFERMGKQTGIIFYTQAEYTSKTDPIMGFRKNIYISNSSSQEKIKEAIKKIDAIGWDKEEQSYFFKYNPVNMTAEKYKNSIVSKEWVVYAKAPRIRRQKGKDGYWEYRPVDINAKLEELFRIWNFKNPKKEDIKQEIIRKEKMGDLQGEKEFDGKLKNFWHSFIYFFNLILEVRNSFSLQIKMKDGKVIDVKTGIDFIASPVKPFFSTTNPYKETNPCGLAIENGDANGAYNIARKGIMILKKLREHAKNDPEFKKSPDLFISVSEWDKAVQNWDKFTQN